MATKLREAKPIEVMADDAANLGNLTCAYGMDPLGGMAHYSVAPIEIEPLAAQERKA